MRSPGTGRGSSSRSGDGGERSGDGPGWRPGVSGATDRACVGSRSRAGSGCARCGSSPSLPRSSCEGTEGVDSRAPGEAFGACAWPAFRLRCADEGRRRGSEASSDSRRSDSSPEVARRTQACTSRAKPDASNRRRCETSPRATPPSSAVSTGNASAGRNQLRQGDADDVPLCRPRALPRTGPSVGGGRAAAPGRASAGSGNSGAATCTSADGRW